MPGSGQQQNRGCAASDRVDEAGAVKPVAAASAAARCYLLPYRRQVSPVLACALLAPGRALRGREALECEVPGEGSAPRWGLHPLLPRALRSGVPGRPFQLGEIRILTWSGPPTTDFNTFLASPSSRQMRRRRVGGDARNSQKPPSGARRAVPRRRALISPRSKTPDLVRISPRPFMARVTSSSSPTLVAQTTRFGCPTKPLPGAPAIGAASLRLGLCGLPKSQPTICRCRPQEGRHHVRGDSAGTLEVERRR